MASHLLKNTYSTYKENIDMSNIKCGLGQDITSKDKQKIFLKAGTPVTEKISQQIQQLKKDGIIDDDSPDDCITIVEPCKSSEILQSIMSTVKTNPVLSQCQLSATLNTIANYVRTQKIPEKIIEHLTVFSKNNPDEFEHTLSNLIFGTHIGKALNYSTAQLNELMCVLFYEDIGYARIDPMMKNAYKVHPILSREILEYAGINNPNILAAISEHEEKLDGSGYPHKLTQIHEYAQISQVANQYSRIFEQSNDLNTTMGKLILLGQQFDFRTSHYKPSIYAPKLQKPLIKILQEKLKSPKQLKEYASHLHNELTNVIKWSNSNVSQHHEVLTIQQKIKSSLWISKQSQSPFQVALDDLNDTQLCKEFINDAMTFMYSIVEPANYLNRVLHIPIEKNGHPISGETILQITSPNTY